MSFDRTTLLGALTPALPGKVAGLGPKVLRFGSAGVSLGVRVVLWGHAVVHLFAWSVGVLLIQVAPSPRLRAVGVMGGWALCHQSCISGQEAVGEGSVTVHRTEGGRNRSQAIASAAT